MLDQENVKLERKVVTLPNIFANKDIITNLFPDVNYLERFFYFCSNAHNHKAQTERNPMDFMGFIGNNIHGYSFVIKSV